MLVLLLLLSLLIGELKVVGCERKGRVYREKVPKEIHFSERDGFNMGDAIVL